MNDAPAATAPVPNCPVNSLTARFESAETETAPALRTLPSLAWTTLVSLSTATAAPIPTNPPAPSNTVRLMSSLSVALTSMLPPALSVPSASAETLSATERTATEAPAPTKPPETWPPMTVTLSCSLALTPIELPALAVPAMSAEVPAGAGTSFSMWLPMLVAAEPVLDFTRFWLVLSFPPPSLLKLPSPPVTVPLALSDWAPALLSADLPLPSVALPVLLPLSSLELFWICVPIDQTLTAPPTPTNPPAPLTSKPLMFFSPTALTSTSFLAVTDAPDLTFAAMLLLTTPTSTAPETPTNPPAMPSTKVWTLTLLAALT